MDQVGTPFEIYNFPNTNFVAGFVGILNTADAEVLDPAKGLISMDGIQFESSDGLPDKRKGEKIRISIRPERISFASEGQKKPMWWIAGSRTSHSLVL